MSINLLRRALYYMTRESQQHAMKMAEALTEGEQICIALKALLSLSPVGIGTLRTWIADGTSVMFVSLGVGIVAQGCPASPSSAERRTCTL